MKKVLRYEQFHDRILISRKTIKIPDGEGGEVDFRMALVKLIQSEGYQSLPTDFMRVARLSVSSLPLESPSVGNCRAPAWLASEAGSIWTLRSLVMSYSLLSRGSPSMMLGASASS